MSILGAELYALEKAVKWISSDFRNMSNYVIFTDSLSALELLKGGKLQNYTVRMARIQRILIMLNKKRQVHMQFVPGHKQIKGNELADTAAKFAHQQQLESVSLAKSEWNATIHRSISKQWQMHWTAMVEKTRKGIHFHDIKQRIEYWPWSTHESRRAEVALARMRIGHCGLNAYLRRFRLTEDPSCECGDAEDLAHYLFACHRHRSSREELKRQIELNGADFSFRGLLGGAAIDSDKQKRIVNAVIKYLQDTNKLQLI